MNIQKVLAKVERNEGLTAEEIQVYQENVKPIRHVYGKYGTLKKKYLEEKGIDWIIADLPTYLHNVDKEADELYEDMYARLSKNDRYKRTGDFLEDLRRQTEMQQLIEEEILNELIYV